MIYACALCHKFSCCDEAKKDTPKNCPMMDQETLKKSLAVYEDETIKRFFKASAEIEAMGYGVWTRVKETLMFCEKMGYRHIGIAFCKGLQKEAQIFEKMLRSAGFQSESIMCKTGGTPKEFMGLEDHQKVRPGTYEVMCNPIAQAFYLNEKQTEFNIVIGLCVGHDALFYKHSEAMTTTLIVKDRALAHNPAGALYCSEGYLKNK